MGEIILFEKVIRQKSLPYFMITVLYELTYAEQHNITFHSSWETEGVKQIAEELLFELSQSVSAQCEELRNQCLPIMRRSIYRIDAVFWACSMELLLVKYCR